MTSCEVKVPLTRIKVVPIDCEIDDWPRRFSRRISFSRFGEGMNAVPPVHHTPAVAGAVVSTDRIPTVHVVLYRADEDGNLEVLTGKETRASRKNQLDVPGGKVEAGESIMEAIRRECLEQADLKFGHTTLGTASKLQAEVKGVGYDMNVYLVRLERGQTVKHSKKGSGPNPLRDVKWRKVADLLKAYHSSHVLRWACHQRLVSNTREPYKQPPALQPPYVAPFWGRDVPCTCDQKCASESKWGK